MSFEERILAHMATGVENRDPHALAMLDTLQPGHARLIGITGPPGAGKSTLVNALIAALRGRGKTVAVLAIDPSSRITGGAILGDRIRMLGHHADPGVFIRSMASRGAYGGLAAAAADVARLMSAAGKDYVLIETVGVGQDEIEIARLAQVTIVVLLPGMGDDVQALKAGILEIADIFAINKSDQPGAERLERQLEDEHKPVVRTVAIEAKGIEDLLDAIEGQWRRPPGLPSARSAPGNLSPNSPMEPNT
jgi:LAO/AO transport system kinase